MSPTAFQNPVKDSVPKINQEIAVGEDLAFQCAWWTFERIVWTLFVLIIACDLAGLFGRGPLAHAHLQNSAIDMKYDRIARYGTPSTVTINLAPGTAVKGEYHLYVSQSLVDQLGTERVIPQPKTTAIGTDGLTYTFPDSGPGRATVEFSLQPAKPGHFHFTVQVPGTPPLQAGVFVMP